MWEILHVCGRGSPKVFLLKSKGERPLGSRRRWDDNIIMVYQEVRRGMGWINLPQGMDMWRSLVSAVKTFRFYQTQGIS